MLLIAVNTKYVPTVIQLLAGFFKGVKVEWIDGIFTRAFIALYSASMLIAVYYHAKRAVTSYVLTYDELIIRKGLITRKQIYIPLLKVRSVTVTSSFFGKFLRYGTIHIDTGSSTGAVTLANVVNPNEKTRLIVDNVKVATGKD